MTAISNHINMAIIFPAQKYTQEQIEHLLRGFHASGRIDWKICREFNPNLNFWKRIFYIKTSKFIKSEKTKPKKFNKKFTKIQPKNKN